MIRVCDLANDSKVTEACGGMLALVVEVEAWRTCQRQCRYQMTCHSGCGVVRARPVTCHSGCGVVRARPESCHSGCGVVRARPETCHSGCGVVRARPVTCHSGCEVVRARPVTCHSGCGVVPDLRDALSHLDYTNFAKFCCTRDLMGEAK